MISSRELQKLLPLVLLAIAAVSPLIQAVGASYFFDHQVVLHWKADPTLRTFLAGTPPASSAEVNVLLVFSQKPTPTELQELGKYGGIGTFTGHVASMHLRLDLLPRVASLDFVDHIYYPKTQSPHQDTSISEILADKTWQTARDPTGRPITGAGVIIGIVDTGIDPTHHDFFFENGTSKIPYLWDQSTNGRKPQGFDYGNECTKPEIEAGSCSEIDGSLNGRRYFADTGHGTAVAAVAASTGKGTDLFDNCFRYDGKGWHNDIALCHGMPTSATTFLAGPSDYRYFGSDVKFNQIFISLAAAGNYNQLDWEYSQGGGRWSKLTFNTNSFYNPAINFGFPIDNDGTMSFAQNGTIFFRPPTDWAKDIVNQADGYWIRVAAAEVTKPALVQRILASPPYFGVAPDALIIPVKLRDGTDISALDGIKYILSKAEELGLPVVINDSFGGILGPHDGTDPLELALTDLASQGIPIVVAAGNFGNSSVHVDGKLLPGQSVTVPWFAQDVQGQNVDIWYSVSDIIGVTVRTPGGVEVTGPTPDSGKNTIDGTVIITSDQSPTGREWFVSVNSTNPLRWTFTLKAMKADNGKWDAWTRPGQFAPDSTGISLGLYKIDSADTIAWPGNAKGVITVGGYTTTYYKRNGCVACIDYDTANGRRGIAADALSSGVGELDPMSGFGPTRDGRSKPDIAAPGRGITAARPFNKEVDIYNDVDNHHSIVSGTSFSSAHVAGVIALMLQMNRYMSPNEIKTILAQDARQDKFTGVINKVTGSPYWGWGKLNALNSTLDAPSLYALTIEVTPRGLPITANLTVDRQEIRSVPLNKTNPIVLEFRSNGNHTVSISPIIQVDDGRRYVLSDGNLTFSAGGLKTFHYQLQFHLNVKSEFGYPSGSGWYNANSTAIASVAPGAVEGYRFLGWIGDVSSDSPAVEVRMDSSKQIVAVWNPAHPFMNTGTIIGLVLAVAISVMIALAVYYKLPKRLLSNSRTLGSPRT